jgi:hypothetical protein
MPVDNQGSQQIEANIQKSFNPKSQDAINNERYIARMEEEKLRKEGVNKKENEWIEKEKEHDRKQDETLNQREFFGSLLKNLKDGKISPKDTIDFEAINEDFTAEEIGAMDDHQFALFVERGNFARELNETRKALERKKIGNTIAKEIETKRENDWAKKVELMTPSEREEFDRKYIENVDKIEE